MFRDSSIPSEFNKIALFSDNYLVWVKDNVLDNDHVYEAYIQYLQPSFYVVYVEDYRITTFDNIESSIGLVSSGDYEVTYSFVKHPAFVDDEFITNSETARADFPVVFICQFIVVIMFVWVFKQLSRLFFKGGLC